MNDILWNNCKLALVLSLISVYQNGGGKLLQKLFAYEERNFVFYNPALWELKLPAFFQHPIATQYQWRTRG